MVSPLSNKPDMDEDEKAFYEYTQGSKVCVAIWEKIAARDKDNETSLADEMEVTANYMDDFINRLEKNLKKKTFRRESLGSDEYDKCKEICHEFEDGLKFGFQIMSKIMDVLGISVSQGKYDQNFPLVFKSTILKDLNESSSKEGTRDRIETATHQLFNLMTRFARVLEAEGIPHNFPVPPPPPPTIVPKVYQPKEYSQPLSLDEKSSRSSQSIKSKKKSSQLTSYSSQRMQVSSRKSSKSDVGLTSPLAFIENYAVRNLLSTELVLVKSSKEGWLVEYVYSLKVHNITGEGRGKTHVAAKQSAASEVLKIIIAKQKKGTLPPEMKPLSFQETNKAMSLMCEAIDYEGELQFICAKANERPPIFSSIINAPGNAVRCKALGVNAVGRGKTKDIARRMAAKLVLDAVAESKKKAKDAAKALLQ